MKIAPVESIDSSKRSDHVIYASPVHMILYTFDSG